MIWWWSIFALVQSFVFGTVAFGTRYSIFGSALWIHVATCYYLPLLTIFGPQIAYDGQTVGNAATLFMISLLLTSKNIFWGDSIFDWIRALAGGPTMVLSRELIDDGSTVWRRYGLAAAIIIVSWTLPQNELVVGLMLLQQWCAMSLIFSGSLLLLSVWERQIWFHIRFLLWIRYSGTNNITAPVVNSIINIFVGCIICSIYFMSFSSAPAIAWLTHFLFIRLEKSSSQ